MNTPQILTGTTRVYVVMKKHAECSYFTTREDGSIVFTLDEVLAEKWAAHLHGDRGSVWVGTHDRMIALSLACCNGSHA